MSAQAPLKRSGRKHPPRENLLGRTAVRRLLHCSRSTLASLHDRGELVPDVVDADGSRWYTLEAVLAFAETWNDRRKPSKKSKAPKKAPKKARASASPVASIPIAPASDYDPDPVRRGIEKTFQPTPERVGSRPTATAIPEGDPVYNPDPMRREVAKPSPVADAPARGERAEAVPSLQRSGAFDVSYVVPAGVHAPARSSLPAAPPRPPAPSTGRVPASIKSTMVINPAWFSEDYQPPPPSER